MHATTLLAELRTRGLHLRLDGEAASERELLGRVTSRVRRKRS
jgi:hypothetical protein